MQVNIFFPSTFPGNGLANKDHYIYYCESSILIQAEVMGWEGMANLNISVTNFFFHAINMQRCNNEYPTNDQESAFTL